MATFLNYSPLDLAGRQQLGPFALSIEDDGGVVRGADVRVGFERRDLEKISLRNPFVQVVNYSDRLDFNAAPAFNFVAATAFEELLHLEVPERAQYIRALLIELSRISSHLLFFSGIARSVGQNSLMNHCLREWERICDVFEMYCGSRLGFGSICIGGVMKDASDGWFFRIEKALASCSAFIPQLNENLLYHPFFLERARRLAVVSREQAKAWNLSGPNARASGYDTDLRAQRPFVAYSKVFQKPRNIPENSGDAWTRVNHRIFEVQHSMDLIQALFRKIPDGNFRIRVGTEVEAGAGSTFRQVEGPRGQIGLFVRCEGGGNAAAIRYFCPSSMIVNLLPAILEGTRTEDIFLAIQSFDISFSEVDK